MQSTSSIRAAIGTLIVATSIVQLANGFFGTFISLRVALEGFGATLAGLVLSSYFAGFTLGALRCGRIIERIGHIRAYAAFGGLAAAATAAMPFLVGPLPWLVLRAVVGFGCAGLFIATESWLNAKAPPESRGRVFSLYMVGTFVALAVGQLLIGSSDVESPRPFNAIVALFARRARHGEHDPGGAAAGDRRADASLRTAHAGRAGRRRRLRAERDDRRHVLRARTGVDAGRGDRPLDDRALHVRGRARRAPLPGSGRAAVGPP